MNKCVCFLICFIHFITVYGQKIYLAEYRTLSISTGFSDNKHDLSVWNSIDTINLNANDFMVVVEQVMCYANEDYIYFQVYRLKSNVDWSQKGSKPDEVIVDRKSNLIYLINEKMAYECVRNELDLGYYTGGDSLLKKVYTDHGKERAVVLFDLNIPVVLSSKLMTGKIPFGVSEIITSKQKTKLLNFKEVSHFDFTTKLSFAKKECQLTSQKLDVLFQNLQK